MAQLNKDDNMSWLIKTVPKEDKPQEPMEANADNFKKFLEANNKSQFDFNKIMDDSSIGSLLHTGNGPTRATTAVSYAPGVNLDDQVKNGPPRISKDSDSISDLSSKGSTEK